MDGHHTNGKTQPGRPAGLRPHLPPLAVFACAAVGRESLVMPGTAFLPVAGHDVHAGERVFCTGGLASAVTAAVELREPHARDGFDSILPKSATPDAPRMVSVRRIAGASFLDRAGNLP